MTDDLYGEAYREALEAAARWHAGHLRKGSGAPYVSHLLTVSAIVWEDGGREVEAIAALLHDAVEDGKATLDEIRSRFGDEVATIVADCTDARSDPDGEKDPWFGRKVAHVEHLRTVAASDRAAATMRVVGADKLANVNSMLVDHRRDPDIWGRFKGGLGGNAWYLGRMAEVVVAVLPDSMVASELELGVDALDALMREAIPSLGDLADRLTAVVTDVDEIARQGAAPHLGFELARAVTRRRGEHSAALDEVVGRWLGPEPPVDLERLRRAVDLSAG